MPEKKRTFSQFYCESRLKSLARDQAVSPRPSHSAGCTWPRTLCDPLCGALVYVPPRTAGALSFLTYRPEPDPATLLPPARFMYDPCTHSQALKGVAGRLREGEAHEINSLRRSSLRALCRCLRSPSGVAASARLFDSTIPARQECGISGPT